LLESSNGVLVLDKHLAGLRGGGGFLVSAPYLLLAT